MDSHRSLQPISLQNTLIGIEIGTLKMGETHKDSAELVLMEPLESWRALMLRTTEKTRDGASEGKGGREPARTNESAGIVLPSTYGS